MFRFLRRLAQHIYLTSREFLVNTRHGILPAADFFLMRFFTPFGLFGKTVRHPSGGNHVVDALNAFGQTEITPANDEQIAALRQYFYTNVDAGAGRVYPDLAAYFDHHRGERNQRPPALFATGKADCPITRFALNDELVEIASRYMGVPKDKMHCLSFLDSLIRLEAEPNKNMGKYDFGLEFHRDVDGYRFLKMFVYLTDCFEGDGHHEYYLTTHGKTPAVVAPIVRYSNTEVEAAIPGIQRKIIQGNAGFGFAEDTFGFHRGTKPKNNDRLILNIQFMDSAFPELFPGTFPVIARP